MKLQYNRASAKWTDALPTGNGRLGALMFGGPEMERIQLNEDTLWSGGPRNTDNGQEGENSLLKFSLILEESAGYTLLFHFEWNQKTSYSR
ncbi:glycoside hydrolase N-terminal domain-containing protein [Paenibacillus sp. MMO-177]|uniref:glycoside hydrolase N-terminal domain-containing protein n=1 Tax=Paenibacillus sp. MMO-177 TaxID=3081289 RepID=UPI003FA7B1F2